MWKFITDLVAQHQFITLIVTCIAVFLSGKLRWDVIGDEDYPGRVWVLVASLKMIATAVVIVLGIALLATFTF